MRNLVMQFHGLIHFVNRLSYLYTPTIIDEFIVGQTSADYTIRKLNQVMIVLHELCSGMGTMNIRRICQMLLAVVAQPQQKSTHLI